MAVETPVSLSGNTVEQYGPYFLFSLHLYCLDNQIHLFSLLLLLLLLLWGFFLFYLFCLNSFLLFFSLWFTISSFFINYLLIFFCFWVALLLSLPLKICLPVWLFLLLLLLLLLNSSYVFL